MSPDEVVRPRIGGDAQIATTGNGLGLRPGGARRPVREFAIDGTPGGGMTVTVVSRPQAGRRRQQPARKRSGSRRPTTAEARTAQPVTTEGDGERGPFSRRVPR